MKTIIAGSRQVYDYELVKAAIAEAGFEITEVISGGARGVDAFGEKWAKEKQIPIRVFPAKWNDLSAPGAIIKEKDGRAYNVKAGFDRNEQMALNAEALIAIMKDDSSGTKDMISRAQKHGLKVYVKVV